MPDLDAQRRAYELLQWVPYSLPTEFNEDLAADGYYTRLQRQRSDAALNAWDKEHGHTPGDQLAAWRELQRLGILGDNDFFLPASKHRYQPYVDRLREHNARATEGAPSTAGENRRNRQRRTGKRLASTHAEPGRSPGDRA